MLINSKGITATVFFIIRLDVILDKPYVVIPPTIKVGL
jgi:hypothetical protein